MACAWHLLIISRGQKGANSLFHDRYVATYLVGVILVLRSLEVEPVDCVRRHALLANNTYPQRKCSSLLKSLLRCF